MLQAKVEFYRGANQPARDLMKKAREIALATLKNEEDEAYSLFLIQFINMHCDFAATEEIEVQMLLKVHEELVEVQKKIDSRGKLFETFSDDKHVKIESIKYELLKRTNMQDQVQKRAAFQQGITSIKATYDHMR